MKKRREREKKGVQEKKRMVLVKYSQQMIKSQSIEWMIGDEIHEQTEN